MVSNQAVGSVLNTTTRGLSKSKISLLRRSKRDAVENAVAGFNLLGIALSMANPILGSICSVIALIIPFIFPGGDPKHIQDMIWDERSKQQKMKMLDFKNHLEEIRDHYTTNNETAQRRLLALFDSMSKERCSFMHTDSIRSSAAYFQSFATLHLELNLLLIIIHKGDQHWQRILEKNVDAYVKYGNFVVQKDSAKNSDVRYIKRLGKHTPPLKIPDELNPAIKNWTQLLPSAIQQNDLINYGAIRDDVLVSFKVAGYSNPLWFSCWDSYYLSCDHRDCPGEDNPMKSGCKGEKFRIKAIDKVEDGIIRTCSWVGLFYTYMKGEYWWVSTYLSTGSCPGSSTYLMKLGICSSEAWEIEVLGKPCGVPVTDRDVVLFTNRYNAGSLDRYMSETRPDVMVVIFRSDVAYGKYNEGLQMCQGKY